MLCPHCQTYAETDAIVCPGCGKVLPRGENTDTGAQAIRQGRRARATGAGKTQTEEKPSVSMGRQGTSRVYGETEAKNHDESGRFPVYADPEIYEEEGVPLGSVTRGTNTRSVYGDPAARREQAEMQRPVQRKDRHPLNKRMINWARVALAAAILCVLAVIGVYFYLTRSPAGQRVMARMGRDATATAMWEVGEEKMDTGDIQGAIELFLKAQEKDGEENVNVSGLLMLGSAYEAIGQTDEAEALYRMIFTDVVPSAPEAYTNTIRILLASGREAEAAEMMQLAFTRTGNANFYTQRREMLPTPPIVDVTAGTYEYARHLNLASEEGFQVYYTFDEEALLPEEGTLFTEALFIDEGQWKLRAVAVNGELVSDELKATYRVVMPSPGTPNCNLAPNTYARRIPVKLRKNPDNEKDTDIIIYYTIDGSIPDEDSPIYVGEAIIMPAGVVTLQAVAVNKYGKASNTFSRTFKFDTKPLPLKSYTPEDTANGVVLYDTTQEQFEAKYGAPQATERVTLADYPDGAVKCTYGWGYAVYGRARGNMHLVELYFTELLKGPRSTGIGDSEATVVGKFRDMGQVESPSGNRGLYYTSSGTGRIYADLDGERLIRYVTYTADSHTWHLDYIENAGKVVKAIRMVFIP